MYTSSNLLGLQASKNIGIDQTPIMPHAIGGPEFPFILLFLSAPSPKSSSLSCKTTVRPIMLNGLCNLVKRSTNCAFMVPL
ncbi:hypothetical protein BpHYR1_041203 [Brachionus plicatilis]|uniref:Uncharacterized protein n=1 Tax=Brachionus plicatilis TaxID=10195 RepID=A0A3M7P302_BRAPC|nr:hypothetical protein BpHYR1_041203 [Brachionus plicatilis]